jgi:hypothetical protein
MPLFKVTVEKKLSISGTIEVEAADSDEALEMVGNDIHCGALQSNSEKIEWDDPDYEDGSFGTTGNVD